jgi:hypothetical protein
MGYIALFVLGLITSFFYAVPDFLSPQLKHDNDDI